MPKQLEITLNDAECRRLQQIADSVRLWPIDVAQFALRHTLDNPQIFLTWLKQQRAA
jgi:hypothetical protein